MRDRKAFTLIELLVVISIIALLSSVVISNLSAARDKGRYARALQDMHQIEVASQGYFSDNGFHAADVGTNVAPAFVSTYLRSWPTPPCGSTWTYDWENHLSTTGFVGVQLRNNGSAVYSYCTDRSSSCSGEAASITSISNKQLSCS